jgi:3-deoxy-7-phosphoheptulonate synthase
MFRKLNDVPPPDTFKAEIPITESIKSVKAERDALIKGALTGENGRFLLIIGPCSADDAEAVRDYVSRLAKVQERTADKLVIVPRVYTNKPRTNGQGYKGMLHQPDPNAPTDINAGIRAIRRTHILVIGESGLSAADEMLYPENLAYVDDLLSYHAVGARSVENQQHRLVASGAEEPVGMKNPTSGDLTVLFNSILAAQSPHTFLYRGAEVETAGNPFAHAILRGSVNRHGENIPNYHYEDLARGWTLYDQYGYKNPAAVIDLNHGNSNKRPEHQPRIMREIMASIKFEPRLKALTRGLMIESYIEPGAQKPGGGVYGKSITDPCLGWAETEKLVYELAELL